MSTNITQLKREALAARVTGWHGEFDNYANCRRYKDSANVEAGNVYLTVHGERIDAEPGANGYFDVQAVMCGGQDIMDLLDSKMVQLLADRAYWNGK